MRATQVEFLLSNHQNRHGRHPEPRESAVGAQALVAAIHTLTAKERSWAAGTSPAMTKILREEKMSPGWPAFAGHDSEF
jgi:hypothetical protein